MCPVNKFDSSLTQHAFTISKPKHNIEVIRASNLESRYRKSGTTERRSECAALPFEFRSLIFATRHDCFHRSPSPQTQRAQRRNVRVRKMQLRINISAHQWLKIVNPAEQHAAGNNIISKSIRSLPTCNQEHRGKMRPGGITSNINTARIESQRRSLPMQRGNRPPALLHNRSKRGVRRQRVINRRERNSIRQAIRRRKQRFVLRQFLPVTSVEINQQRRISGPGRKIVERFIRSLAPEQILLAAKSLLRFAAARSISVQVRCDRGHT